MSDLNDNLSNVTIVNVQKPNQKNISSDMLQEISSDITTKNIIKDDIVVLDKKVRKDVNGKSIVKKGKAHKISWVDKVKKSPLTHVIVIENYSKYIIEKEEEPKTNTKTNSIIKNKKEEDEEPVKCKCLIF